MGAMSKHKGNAFESLVAKMLSEWSGQEFKRVPASGALRWGNQVWTYGDILPPIGVPVVIECKHHAKVSVDDLLGNRKLGLKDSQIGKWWFEQTLPDCQRAADAFSVTVSPMLVWRQNRGRIRCAVQAQAVFCYLLKIPYLVVGDESGPAMCLVDFEHFLADVPYQMFLSTLVSS